MVPWSRVTPRKLELWLGRQDSHVSTGATPWRCLRGGRSVCSSAGCFSGAGPTLPCSSWVLQSLGRISLCREAVKQSKRQEFTPGPAVQTPCPAFAGLAMGAAVPAASTFLPGNSQASAITGDVGGRQRTGCLQAPSSLNHLLSPLVARTCSCLSCVYPSPIPFLPFPQADESQTRKGRCCSPSTSHCR